MHNFLETLLFILDLDFRVLLLWYVFYNHADKLIDHNDNNNIISESKVFLRHVVHSLTIEISGQIFYFGYFSIPFTDLLKH